MNKKILTLAMAAVMTFAFGITAAAATSVTQAIYNPYATTVAYSNDGTTVAYIDKAEIVGDLAEKVDATAGAVISQQAETERVDALKTAANEKKLNVIKTVMITLQLKPGQTEVPDTVVVKVEGLGVKAGDSAMVWHYTNNAWQLEACEVTGEDEITISGLKSFSPFAISKVEKVVEETPAASAAPAAPAAAPAASASSAPVAKSPKTGFSLEILFSAFTDLF